MLCKVSWFSRFVLMNNSEEGLSGESAIVWIVDYYLYALPKISITKYRVLRNECH